MSQTSKILLTICVLLLMALRFCLGFLVIQPIGAIPEGTTIVYWRLGTNFDFVESPDGLVKKAGLGLSLWTRAIALGSITEPILKREVLRLPYSEQLYLISTKGEKYEK